MTEEVKEESEASKHFVNLTEHDEDTVIRKVDQDKEAEGKD